MPDFTIILRNEALRDKARRAIERAPIGYTVTFKETSRSLEQNARMWAMLNEISHKAEYFGKFRSPEDWKDIFTASLRGEEIDMVPSLDGKRTILLGLRTSKMKVSEMNDLMTLMEAYCASHDITLTDREAA